MLYVARELGVFPPSLSLWLLRLNVPVRRSCICPLQQWSPAQSQEIKGNSCAKTETHTGNLSVSDESCMDISLHVQAKEAELRMFRDKHRKFPQLQKKIKITFVTFPNKEHFPLKSLGSSIIYWAEFIFTKSVQNYHLWWQKVSQGKCLVTAWSSLLVKEVGINLEA